MKTHFFRSLKLTVILIVLAGGLYPLLISAIGKLTPGGGDGEVIKVNGKVVGFANVGQKFTKDEYFWSRPSAVNYAADGSAGSNKGPNNPDHLKDVEGRIQNFLKHNPGITRSQIPAELVTASGSGLDPDISPEGAKVQIPRIAKVRNFSVDKVTALVNTHTEQPLLGLFGPAKINVLKLNVALNELKR